MKQQRTTNLGLAKALGHPARIVIIEYILKVNSCICGDIVNELPLAQSTVFQHLKELKNASLIKGSVEGNALCYCISETGFEKNKKFLSKYKHAFGQKQNQLLLN